MGFATAWWSSESVDLCIQVFAIKRVVIAIPAPLARVLTQHIAGYSVGVLVLD